MTKRSIDSLGELQKAVMETVWEKGEATVNEVRERLSRDPEPAYTTVLSVMQKLEKLGWLTHRAEGRTYVYEPTQSRRQEGQHSLRSFTQRVFGGDRLVLFQHLLDDNELSGEDLRALEEMIERRKKEEDHA